MQAKFTASLLAGAGILLLTWSPLVGVYILRKNKEIRIRGCKESIEAAVFVSLLTSFGVLSVVDSPFCSCTAYAVWAVIPIVFIWPAFFLYICRYSRLYHLNAASVGKADEPDASFEDKKPKASHLEKFLTSASAFSLRICNKQDIRTRVRIWTLPFSIIGIILVILVSLNDPFDHQIPETSFLKCTENNRYFYLIFGLMIVEGAFYLTLLLGIIADIWKQASQRGDTLGIKKMLTRMAFDAALSMLTFGILCLLLLAGVINFTRTFGGFVPYTLAFYIDLIVVPLYRASKDIRRRKLLTKRSGLVSNDNLDQIFNNLSGGGISLDPAKLKKILRFQAFLLGEEGYRTMEKHLSLEFGLESLFFIVEAVNYAKMFSQDFKDKVEHIDSENASFPKVGSENDKIKEPRQGTGSVKVAPEQETSLSFQMTKRCVQIYMKFVSSRAPSQVNLPHGMLLRFRGIKSCAQSIREHDKEITSFYGGNDNASIASTVHQFEATPTIFNDLILEMLKMLYMDSFQRYLTDPSNRALWDKFNAEQDELEALG